MEGGQQLAIGLHAPLDVSSSDMLVPIQGQTLQHNWQKYQGKFLPNSLRFEKNGWAAGWNVYNFEYEGSQVKVTSVDIRRPQETKVIGRLNQGEYQLIKQQWNSTVEVENFWWLDSQHVLELNNRFLTIYRKTSTLDDWNGDRFEKVLEHSRADILYAGIDHFFVPSVYNMEASAPFVTIAKAGFRSLLVRIYDPRNDFRLTGIFAITIENRNIGNPLNPFTVGGNMAYFNTYAALNADELLSHAEWTATYTDNRLIVGCHYNNNFDQWAVVADIYGNVFKCVQGYGWVGLHGDLTGGQIPAAFFNPDIGFTGIVMPITSLSLVPSNSIDVDDTYEMKNRGGVGAINYVETKVVGTADRQWYIIKEHYGVVSHLLYVGGNAHAVQLVPISHNFSACYRSPSYASATLADISPQAISLEDMFGEEFTSEDTLWGWLLKALLLPIRVLDMLKDLVEFIPGIGWFVSQLPDFSDMFGFLFVLAPRYCQFVYLQQTFGQYAYVHYNSSQSLPDPDIRSSNRDEMRLGNMTAKNPKVLKDVSPAISECLTFDKQVFSQKADVSHNAKSFVSLLMIAFVSALQTFEQKYRVNEEINLTTASDTGKQFVSNVIENTVGVLANSLYTQSHSDLACSSRIVGLKSLDMFYSTSDQQHIYAGPGYVEHQFVADCIAQSSVDVQAEGRAVQVTWVIKEFTTLIFEYLDYVLEKVWQMTKQNLDYLNNNFEMGSNTIGNVAAIAGWNILSGIVWGAGGFFFYLGKLLNELLDILTKNGIQSNITASISKHSLSVEPTHKYGEKNEVFMWPCWGAPQNAAYTDERVVAAVKNLTWPLGLTAHKGKDAWTFISMNLNKVAYKQPDYSSAPASRPRPGPDEDDIYNNLKGLVNFYTATCYGEKISRPLPADMVKIEGVESILPSEPFKNENIGASEPVFAPSLIHDYIIDKAWDLSMCCSYGGRPAWIAVKDTKLTNGPASNIIVTGAFCGVASPYAAFEVKRGLSKAYMRPYAVTPNTLAFNSTGYNAILDDKLYHAFDGQSYRIVDMVGAPGMNKNRQTFLYAIQLNDRFKRSNIPYAEEMQGNFSSTPPMAIQSIDKLWVQLTVASKGIGLNAGAPGEDRDMIRWSIPVFTEHVSTLPAAVKTMSAMPLGVFDGVTTLCTELANSQFDYKAPVSVDFTIGKKAYRVTEEYICTLETRNAIDIVTDIIPVLGLKFIGATPYEAYFYSQSTRCYYQFTGTGLVKCEMMERFRDIQKGYWDFVNQEVVMPCLMTYKRLNPDIEDVDSETDNIIVPLLSEGNVSGELPPPITTIFNDRSWYKVVSLPSGLAYQGPNRVIINRSVFVEYMLDTLKGNLGKWKKLDREKYDTKREYPEVYSAVDRDVRGIDGWTYNPFVFVTSALGADENVDCLFEWVITFCWPIEMDLIYGIDNYAVVNLMGETMTPGGKQSARPTHVFLTKELFTRTGNYGYYSFRYQSKNGSGNRERLHIWSDQYIAISNIVCEYKPITSRRTEQLTQQLDVQKLKEL